MLIRLVLLLALVGVLGACGQSLGGGARRATVVTSTTIIADLVRNVSGDRFDVVSLVPVGGNPFDYEPTPWDAAAVSQARLYTANGLHYDYFARRLLEATPSLPVVTLSEGLPTRESTIDHGDHGHMFPNPYLYLDPHHAVAYVEKARDALAGIDPGGATTYRANAARYTAELQQLDVWIAAEVATLPPGRRRLMQDHDALVYFAARYGFISYAASYEGTREAAPSPSQYAALIDQVRRNRTPVVFGHVGFGSKLAKQLAQDTGMRFVPGVHAATLGTTDDTDSYLDVMRHNTRLIVESLR